MIQTIVAERLANGHISSIRRFFDDTNAFASIEQTEINEKIDKKFIQTATMLKSFIMNNIALLFADQSPAFLVHFERGFSQGWQPATKMFNWG